MKDLRLEFNSETDGSFRNSFQKWFFIVVLRARFLVIFRVRREVNRYTSPLLFWKTVLHYIWFAPNDSLFVRSFILALRVANLSSMKAGRSAFRSFIKYIITRYFMRLSTGKTLCLILRSVVLSNLVLLKHAFILRSVVYLE